MNILFFGYWGANDGLSQATINPHLEILAEFKVVHRIFYVSIERTEDRSFIIPKQRKISHHPFYSKYKNRLLSKAYDFTTIPRHVVRLIKEHDIDLLMCRSSLAGGIGYLVHRKINIPFTVESFEPHADYMLESGVWKRYGISYLLQKWLEKKQKRYAKYLLPLTNHNKQKLVLEGINEDRLIVMPCVVDVSKFKFSIERRTQKRNKLGLSNTTIVGIYVGKFGDLYCDKKAFSLFKSAFNYFSDFFLILLNSQPSEMILSRCKNVGIDKKSIFHGTVSHNEVSDYLSASDFAFSLHKPTRFSFAFSPIKNGEYWANGLPIVSFPDIGDDSDIIQRENAGLLINGNVPPNWINLKYGIDHRNLYEKIAFKYRDLEIVKRVYLSILQLHIS